MADIFWEELSAEIQKGISRKGHPFRYATLGTVGTDQVVRLRTVVLRNVSEKLDLFIYTDKRSKKVTHIKENPKVSILFYHPKKLLQLKVEGVAHIVTDENILQKYWSGVQPNSRKDYTTVNAPGTPIKNPDHVAYLDHKNHFCILRIAPFKIEYLKLKRPNHIRIKFSKIDTTWESDFLVP